MATAAGTARLLLRATERGLLHPGNVRFLGPGPSSVAELPQLSVAAVGFGAYRVGGGDQEQKHLAALRASLRAGVNLVDTSSHYAADKGPGGGHGASERLVGRAITEAIEAGEVEREGVVLCTKLGHAALGSEQPPGGVEIGPPTGQGPAAGSEVWHSIDPAFVDAEVRASGKRLGLSPDFVLLHNPEYFLSAQLRQGVPIAEAWDAMYSRLGNAFEALERLCDEGAIASGYGVSANFLSCLFSTTGRSNVYEALVLDRVLDVAAAAAQRLGRSATEHRLRIVQLPLNVVESGAVLGRGRVVPEASEGDCHVAARLGVPVIANRPFNALPLPGVSSGDWGRNGATHLQLRDAKPMGAVESLLRRVLMEAIQAEVASAAGASAPSAPLPLQQLALKVSLSAPGVACTLCGMRTERYVEDAVQVLQEAPLEAAQVLRAFTAVRSAAEELGCQRRGLW